MSAAKNRKGAGKCLLEKAGKEQENVCRKKQERSRKMSATEERKKENHIEEYTVGVRLCPNGICGVFLMHGGEKQPGRAEFVLEREKFVWRVLEDKHKVFEEISDEMYSDSFEKQIEHIFDAILERGVKMAAQMGEYLIELEREIVTGCMDKNRNRAIFECKRSLVLWKNDYLSLLNIAETINRLTEKKEDTREVFLSEETACYFKVYEGKVRRVTEQIQFMYEELVHIREALNAALEYDQNRIMKVFTTVTTVFMPLTLIAGWYGMNFTVMPEFTWRYGYLFVIVLSAAVVLLCMLFFRKKKLL